MLHKVHISLVFLILLGLSASCGNHQQQDENRAGVKHFYFEFVDEVQNEYTSQLIEQLSNKLVQHDYIMSEESAAKGWPFYGKVERGARVMKSEIMPPHTNVNRLSPMSELSYNDDEHTLKVIYTIQAIDNSTLNFIKESYRWQNDEWLIFAKKLNSEFEIGSADNNELDDKILKTLIRYTFK